MERFQHIGVNVERKVDSPIYWKRQQLEVLKGVVGVEFGAPKAGVLPKGELDVFQRGANSRISRGSMVCPALQARTKGNGSVQEKLD